MRSKIVTGFVTSVVLAGLGTFAAGARDAPIRGRRARGGGRLGARGPGDVNRKRVRLHFAPAASGEAGILMDQGVPPLAVPKDTGQVENIRLQSDRATTFWGRPIHLG